MLALGDAWLAVVADDMAAVKAAVSFVNGGVSEAAL